MPTPIRRALMGALLAAATATPALAHDRDALLSAPPAHAPAGVCYARVTRPAEYGPPPAPGAHWRLSPPPPGAPGPVWCLIVDPAAPAPLIAPERDGWIRVLCDTDATPARMRRLQRRLRTYGDYEGEASGRYDAATARAVGRFQSERHIAHGGYLSLRTVEAIEAAGADVGGPAIAAVGPRNAGPCCASSALIPPPPPPVVVLPAPRPYSPPSPAGRWLTWPGKRLY